MAYGLIDNFVFGQNAHATSKVTTYSSRAAFISNLQNPININFEGIAPTGGFREYGTSSGLWLHGVNFVGVPNNIIRGFPYGEAVTDPGFYRPFYDWESGAVLNGSYSKGKGGTIYVTLPDGVNAVGCDLMTFTPYGAPLHVTLSTGDSVDVPTANYPGRAFVGFTSYALIKTIAISSPYGTEINLDNFIIGTKQKSVLLVHGTWSDASTWSAPGGMTQSLANVGYVVEAVDFPSEPETQSNETYIELQAKALARRIRELQVRSGNKYTDLVCHSMGGLAARYYLEHPYLWPVDEKRTAYSGVGKLIMLGTPNWGTDGAFLDPIAAVSIGRLAGKPYGADKYDDWSPAIKEQFAEWVPAPVKGANSQYLYSSGFKLGKWKTINGVFQSPIQTVSYDIAGAALGYFFFNGGLDTSNENYIAIAAVANAIPLDPRTRFRRHADYYTQAVQSLVVQNYGVAFPSAAGVEGVNHRTVSAFLANLNTMEDKSGAKVYMVGGTEPLVFDPNSYLTYGAAVLGYLIARHTTLFGPFNTDIGNGGISNDGVVPTDSAFGLDPITRKLLYPAATRAIIGTYHTDLPNNPQAVSQVVTWLGE